jgi:hypothetical protein
MAIFRYMDKKLRASFGTGISATRLNLSNLDTKKDTGYNFVKFTPQLQLGYTFKPQTSLNFNYRGTTRQPSINQLQPLPDNADVLNVFQGNPNLQVGFNHSFSMFFNQYKVLKQRGLWMNLSYNITENAIVNSIVFDKVRKKQVYTPVNVDGVENYYFYANWNKGGGPKKLNYGVNINGNGGKNISFLDNVKTFTKYMSGKIGVSTSYDEENKYSFEFRPELSYNASNAARSPNYFTYGGYVNGFIMLPWKIEVRSEATFDLRKEDPTFPGKTSIITWNASIGRTVFKDKSGKILLMGNDLLDQNRGFNRVINSNIITEERYSKVAQYFQLRFEWSFTKMPGTK